MSGIKELNQLLKTMKPKLLEGEYVFCTLSSDDYNQLNITPLLFFKEQEGITLIISKQEANNLSLSYEAVWKMITLSVHSDLTAVGFLAAITNKLKEHDISLNVVSAYYHDHLFVPIELADKSLDILKKLSDN